MATQSTSVALYDLAQIRYHPAPIIYLDGVGFGATCQPATGKGSAVAIHISEHCTYRLELIEPIGYETSVTKSQFVIS